MLSLVRLVSCTESMVNIYFTMSLSPRIVSTYTMYTYYTGERFILCIDKKKIVVSYVYIRNHNESLKT